MARLKPTVRRRRVACGTGQKHQCGSSDWTRKGSHSKTKAGVRLRCYVSHRVIKKSGEGNLDGWRLPAQELEIKVAHLMRQRLSDMAFIGKLVPNRSAEEIRAHHHNLQTLSADKDTKHVLDLVARIDLRPFLHTQSHQLGRDPQYGEIQAQT